MNQMHQMWNNLIFFLFMFSGVDDILDTLDFGTQYLNLLFFTFS